MENSLFLDQDHRQCVRALFYSCILNQPPYSYTLLVRVLGVEVLQLQIVILHKKVQEDPSTPLQKPREEIEDPGREVDPTSKIQKTIN